MSDMRNFGSSNEKMTMSENIPETNLGATAQFLDTGGLANFHHPLEEEKTNSNSARMIGAAVVAVLLCGAGAYAYMSSSATPKSPVSTSSLPAPSAPQSVAANTPPPAMQTAPVAPPSGNDNALATSPYGSAPVTKSAPVPAATPASGPEDTTVKPHHMRTARIEKAKKSEGKEDTQEAQVTNQLNNQESSTVTQENRAADVKGDATATASAPPAPASTATANAAATPPATPETAIATPSAAPANNNVASNGTATTSSTPLPTPPAPPSSSMASNGQINGQTNGQGAATSAPQNLSPAPSETPTTQPAPITPAPDTSTQQPSQAQPAQVQPQ